MKTQQTLLRLGGALNALFFLFHLFLGWRIHRWNLAPGVRSLLEQMNRDGGVFLTVAALDLARAVANASFRIHGLLLEITRRQPGF